MIITPEGLKSQILGRLAHMIGKSKEEIINIDTTNPVIVTTHDLYENSDLTLFVTGIEKDTRGHGYVIIQNESKSVNIKKQIECLNIEDVYCIYQQLSHVISPSNAIYVDVIDEV